MQYYVQRTLCHSEELHCNDVRIPRKRTLFIIWSPFREIATRVVCFVLDQSIAASDNCLSYACILLFPTGTKVSRGVPIFPLAMT